MDIDKLINEAFVRHSQEERVTFRSLVEMVEQVMQEEDPRDQTQKNMDAAGEGINQSAADTVDIDTDGAGSAFERDGHYLVWGCLHATEDVDSVSFSAETLERFGSAKK